MYSFHLPSRRVLRVCSRGFLMTTPIFSSVPDTCTYNKTIPFTPPWYGGPSPLTHTHYMVPFAPLGRCPCSVKPLLWPLLGIIPAVTCIMLVHTTNTAGNITTSEEELTTRPKDVPKDRRPSPKVLFSRCLLVSFYKNNKDKGRRRKKGRRR